MNYSPFTYVYTFGESSVYFALRSVQTGHLLSGRVTGGAWYLSLCGEAAVGRIYVFPVKKRKAACFSELNSKFNIYSIDCCVLSDFYNTV